MKKRFCIVLMLFSILVMPCFATADNDNPSDWAVNEVQTAVNAGYVPEELQSDYTNPITRKEFAETLVNFYRKTTGRSGITLNIDKFFVYTIKFYKYFFTIKITTFFQFSLT